jgi:hypothetical protein
MDKTHRLVIGECYSVAQALTRAVLYLHLAGWLYKGLRSDNILFFAKDLSEIDFAYPSIAGFEYNRLESAAGLTKDVPADPESNLYRHVGCQGVPVDRKNEEESPNNARAPGKTPYQRIYDVYSLGVILLELGLG